MSSRRDCSIPRCVETEAYLAVPVRFLPSLLKKNGFEILILAPVLPVGNMEV